MMIQNNVGYEELRIKFGKALNKEALVFKKSDDSDGTAENSKEFYKSTTRPEL
jgi:hypothetical protein